MVPVAPFTFARLPRIVFGDGAFARVPSEARVFGTRVLVVTGARSLDATGRWDALARGLGAAGMVLRRVIVAGEPSPELVSEAVAAERETGADVVIGVGGGSALDAAKAIAGMLRADTSVLDHLEGVGRGLPYRGPAVPLVAVPTTAGTGSEATKNAVLSRPGPDGFKKSLRDEALVARVALIDPALLASCPTDVMAADGMDAFTQLLEAFVSTGASEMTDALAWAGMEAFVRGLVPALEGSGDAARAGRSALAFAALQSGIVLAQAGLGAVHGLASPLGACFPVPHGVACGTLLAEATAVNLRALAQRAPLSPALAKYARVAQLLTGVTAGSAADAHRRLVDALRAWVDRFGLARLGRYGVRAEDVPRLVAGSRGGSMKTNPLVLEDDEIATIVARRL